MNPSFYFPHILCCHRNFKFLWQKKGEIFPCFINMLEENSYQVTAWQPEERESPPETKIEVLLIRRRINPHERKWEFVSKISPCCDRMFDMAKMMFLWSENDNEIYNAAFSHFGVSSPLKGGIHRIITSFIGYTATQHTCPDITNKENPIQICK